MSVPIKTDQNSAVYFVIVSLGHEFGHTDRLIKFNHETLSVYGLDLVTKIHQSRVGRIVHLCAPGTSSTLRKPTPLVAKVHSEMWSGRRNTLLQNR
jgi:hypothetical protein